MRVKAANLAHALRNRLRRLRSLRPICFANRARVRITAAGRAHALRFAEQNAGAARRSRAAAQTKSAPCARPAAFAKYAGAACGKP